VEGRRENVERARGRRVDHFILLWVEWTERELCFGWKIDNRESKRRSIGQLGGPFSYDYTPRALQTLVSPFLGAGRADPRIRCTKDHSRWKHGSHRPWQTAIVFDDTSQGCITDNPHIPGEWQQRCNFGRPQGLTWPCSLAARRGHVNRTPKVPAIFG
jgi:hypothetical protein